MLSRCYISNVIWKDPPKQKNYAAMTIFLEFMRGEFYIGKESEAQEINLLAQDHAVRAEDKCVCEAP